MMEKRKHFLYKTCTSPKLVSNKDDNQEKNHTTYNKENRKGIS